MKPLLTLILLILFLAAHPQNIGGTTGMFNTPTAHMQPDGTLMLGAHYLHKSIGSYPYGGYGPYDAMAYFATVSFLPFVEGQFRYTFMHAMRQHPQVDYFGDRMMSLRLQLINGNNKAWPSVVLGFEDFVSMAAFIIDASSPSYFASNYVVSSKKIRMGTVFADLSAGYGFNLSHALMGRSPARIQHDGLFGGMELSHRRFPGSGLILEYDSRRFHAAMRLLLFKHLQLLAGFNADGDFSGGVTYKIQM